MRTFIAITLLASSATAFAAQAAEDRYGPARVQPVTITVPAAPGAAPQTRTVEPYTGRMLSWTGKVEPQAPAAVPTPAPVASAPASLPSNLYDAAPAPIAAGRVQAHPWLNQPQAPTPAAAPRPQPAAPPTYVRPAAYPQAPQPYAPQPRPAAYPQAAQPAPHVRPAPQPMSQPVQPRPVAPVAQARPLPAAQPVLAGGPPASQPSPAAAQPATTPAPAPRRVASSDPNGATTARSYSVVREYGGQPDPIDLPPPQVYWATRPGVTPDQGVVLDDTMNGSVDAVAETEAEIAESRVRRLEREVKAARAERSR